MQQILSRAFMVDVRTPNEFEKGHYPGAVNMPLNELVLHVNKLKEAKRPILVYCLSGARSSAAVALLQQAGVSDVYNAGGIQDLLSYRQTGG